MIRYKYIILSVLLLLMGTENCISQYTYQDYQDSWPYQVFLRSTVGGGGNLQASIVDDILTMTFSAGFEASALKEGPVVKLNTSPLIQYQELGKIGESYTAWISSGWLIISGNDDLYTGFDEEFIVNFNSGYTNSKNYIVSTEVLEKGILTIDAVKTSEAIRSVSYFDGLGRLEQTVQVGITPAQKDIILPVEYDLFGRETKSYLPYISERSDGGFAFTAIQNQTDYYVANYGTENGVRAFSEKKFDSSPLNRITEIAAPGDAWKLQFDVNNKSIGNTTKKEYASNAVNDVRFFSINESNALEDGGYYEPDELYKTISKNENWSRSQLYQQLNTTEEYKNKKGQVILERSYVEKYDGDNSLIGTDAVETYYIYNKLGLLTIVIPPEAINQMYNAGNESMQTFSIVSGDQVLNEELSGSYGFMLSGSSSLTLLPGFSYTAASDASLHINTGFASADLIYTYKYDERNRMIEKKIPGAEVVHMVYDERDRLVAMQDGETRKEEQWLITKYDVLNRPVISAIYNNSMPRNVLQDYLNSYYSGNPDKFYENRTSISGDLNYTNQSFPIDININDYLTVTYYDNYNFGKAKVFEIANNISGETGCFNNVKGQVTGTLAKVLDGDEHTENAQWIASTYYYDKRYRLIQSIADLYPSNNGNNKITVANQYDFVGNVKNTKLVHSFEGTTKTITERFEYDHAGRLKKHWHSVDGGANETLLAENTYNELGELINKKVGETSNGAIVQQMDYRYNIRGWMTSINEDQLEGITGERKFAMKLHYNSGLSGVDEQVQYNGNIAAMEWRAPAQTNIGITGDKQAYGFYYDGLNRLTDANYGTGSTLSNSTWANAFTVSGIKYDLNGNIQELNRERKVPLTKNDVNNITSWGKRSIDQLIYNYSGNQLMAVTEELTSDEKDYTANKFIRDYGFKDRNTTGVDYDYDLNGNMTTDRNKGLQDVQYNHLNLPKKLIGTNNEIIEYIYDANGQKLKKIAPDGSATYYSGSFIYQGNSLDYILHAEGKYKLGSTDGGYHYNVTDHLGNVRLVVKADANRTILDQTDYYPFGMAMNMSLFSSGQKNLYKYNGKELQEDEIGNGSLDWYDYGARFYDPAIARFTAIDPWAESYNNQSTYLYAHNNPIRFTDFMGLGADDEVKKSEIVNEQVDSQNSTVTITERNITSHTVEGESVANEDGTVTSTSTTTVTKTVSRTTINEKGEIEHSESVSYSASQTTTTVKDGDGNVISSKTGAIVKSEPISGNEVGANAQKLSDDIITGASFSDVMFAREKGKTVKKAQGVINFLNASDSKMYDSYSPSTISGHQNDAHIKKLQKQLLKERRRADSLQNVINKMTKQ